LGLLAQIETKVITEEGYSKATTATREKEPEAWFLAVLKVAE
jgi:hypothetical protein